MASDFNLEQWLEESTKASGVPLLVEDEQTLGAVSRMIV
jgi:hypothetical protein